MTAFEKMGVAIKDRMRVRYINEFNEEEKVLTLFLCLLRVYYYILLRNYINELQNSVFLSCLKYNK